MRTKEHWSLCKDNKSFHTAQHFACQLKEFALVNSLSAKTIKVLSKEDLFHEGIYADAQVRWFDGPDNWADSMEISNIHGVCADTINGNVVSFYDTY